MPYRVTVTKHRPLANLAPITIRKGAEQVTLTLAEARMVAESLADAASDAEADRLHASMTLGSPSLVRDGCRHLGGTPWECFHCHPKARTTGENP